MERGRNDYDEKNRKTTTNDIRTVEVYGKNT